MRVMSDLKLILRLSIFFAIFYVIYGQQCRSGTLRVDPDMIDMKLHGPVFRAYQNMGPNTCYDECIRRTRCSSFNYNRITHVCEINFMATTGPGATFVTENQTVFVDIGQYRGVFTKDPCFSMSCNFWEYCDTLPNNTKICLNDAKEVTTVGDFVFEPVLRYDDFFNPTCLLFDVMACGYANFVIQSNSSESYDFLLDYDNRIGIWLNGHHKKSANAGDMLSCDELRSFWVSWEDGSINFGTGRTPSNNHTLIKWQHNDVLTIYNVRLASRYGRQAKWML